MNLDVAFVERMLQHPDLAGLKESRVEPDMLFDKPKDALKFVMDFYAQYAKMPDKATVENTTGVVLNENPVEPLEYYADQVRDRWLGNQLKPGLQLAANEIASRRPKDALDKIKDMVARVSNLDAVPDAGLVDLRDNTAQRLADYEAVKARGGKIDGLPLPWSILNQATMGVHKGELWFFVARTKTGKSWAEFVLAHNFWVMGYKALVISMEMSLSKVARRIDAIAAQIPYGDFKSGKLDQVFEDRFKATLDAFKGVGNPSPTPMWLVGNGRVRTTQDIEVLINELEPDVVLVDGMYLMQPSVGGRSGNGGKWERVASVADDLQKLAQRKQVPLIATSQFGRKVSKENKDATSGDVGFAFEISQNADCLIGMFQDEEMRTMRRMLLRVLEHREGEPVNLLVNWDFTSMNFSEIGVVSGEELAKKDDKDDDSRVQF